MAKEKDNPQPTNNSSGLTADRFKAIQEILMGSEMEQIDGKFANFQNRMDNMRNEIEEQIAGLRKDLLGKIDQLEKTLTDNLEEKHDSLLKKEERDYSFVKEEIARLDKDKARRKDLGKLFLLMGEAMIKDDE
ncbi:MAG: hypothetical protein AAF206_17395 [Bacteroidota bacterium]